MPYKVVGYINAGNLVERVETWLENPIFGDMLVESIYTDYRDANGVKYPGDDRPEARRLADVRSADPRRQRESRRTSQQLVTPPPPPAGRGGGPGGGLARARRAPRDRRPRSSPTASTASTARTTRWPSSSPTTSSSSSPDRRTKRASQAIIAEAKKVIPNKPIRYGVISHHHFDHTSGLPAVVAEGITIVTHQTSTRRSSSAP